jgi:hypothetical protein
MNLVTSGLSLAVASDEAKVGPYNLGQSCTKEVGQSEIREQGTMVREDKFIK